MFFFTPTRKLVRGVKTANQVYRGKIYWENFCRECSSKHFRNLSRRTWKFIRKLLAGLSKAHSMCPEEHFHSKILEASLWAFQLFRIISEVSLTTAKNYFQGWQNCKKTSRSKLEKRKTYSKRKKVTFLFFFSRFCAKFLLTFSEKIPAWLLKL